MKINCLVVEGLLRCFRNQAPGGTLTMDDGNLPGELQNMGVPDDNPEAMFDFLTIQSLKGRYGGVQTPNQQDPVPEKGFQSETDFETYVQQFPIDDTISQCFAASNSQETKDNKAGPVYVSGGKRPDPSSHKQRKKFGRKPAYDVSVVDDDDDDARSRDPKRSKTGGVFSKRHKWLGTKHESHKTHRKQPSSSEQSESDSVFISDDSKRTIEIVLRNDSNSTSDSQITSFSEVFMRNQDQVVPYLAGNLAVSNGPQERPLQGAMARADLDKASDRMTEMLIGDSINMIQKLEDLTPEEATSLRDPHGNTLLHRSVIAGSEDAVKYLLEKFPDMTSYINSDNLTAVELAAKMGNYDCLKVILERNQRRKSIGPSLVNRLLTITSQYGQVGCLSLLLQKLTSEPHGSLDLPRDPRGNTAAHLAAKYGHLNCLQALVALGFDVSSENVLGQRPLHVAHQSRQHGCFEYLLVLHVARDLMHVLRQVDGNTRSDNPTTIPVTDNILTCFQRFQELFAETQQMLADCKVSIMQALVKLQNDLDLFIKHTATDSATKRKKAREKLEELASEIDRLEDTLEFSPLLEKEGALTRLLTSVNEDVAKAREHAASGSPNSGKNLPSQQAETALRYIIRDIHKEFLLENWSVDHIYAKYLGGSNLARGSTPSDDVWNKPRLPVSDDSVEHPDDTDQALTESSENTEVPYTNTKSIIKNSTQGNEVKHETNVISIAENQNKSAINSEDDHTRVTADIAGNDTGDTDKCDSASEDETAPDDPTERPFTKLLSLDERIDLLIAGERAREKNSDSETLVSGNTDTNNEAELTQPDSVYTTTFTSITSDSTSGLSDWYTKLGLTSLESSPEEMTSEMTSGSASYWWDQGEEKQERWPGGGQCRRGDTNFSADVRQQIRLQLDSEEQSYEELRRQRLISHLRALEQSRMASDNFCERITSSTGEVMGGFGGKDGATDRIVVDVTGTLKKRQETKPVPKPRGSGKQKLFTLEDAIATGPKHLSNQSAAKNNSPTMNWEDMSFTDEDDWDGNSWYEMESRQYRGGTSTSERSTTPQSYV